MGHRPYCLDAVDDVAHLVAQDVRHLGRPVVVCLVHFGACCNGSCDQKLFSLLAFAWVSLLVDFGVRMGAICVSDDGALRSGSRALVEMKKTAQSGGEWTASIGLEPFRVGWAVGTASCGCVGGCVAGIGHLRRRYETGRPSWVVAEGSFCRPRQSGYCLRILRSQGE